jgi:hypothetical protein
MPLDKLSLAIALTTAEVASACAAAPIDASSQPAGAAEKVTSTLTCDPSAISWIATDVVIPICRMTPRYRLEKAWARNAATPQWVQAARRTFTGWGDRPNYGSAQSCLEVDDDGHVPLHAVPGTTQRTARVYRGESRTHEARRLSAKIALSQLGHGPCDSVAT